MAVNTEPKDTEGPRIERVNFDKGVMIVKFRSGAKLFFDATVIPGLRAATEDEINDVTIAPSGHSMAWKHLHVKISARSLLWQVCNSPC